MIGHVESWPRRARFNGFLECVWGTRWLQFILSESGGREFILSESD
jgi:hypothetical protein